MVRWIADVLAAGNRGEMTHRKDGRLSILLVEDDDSLRTMLSTYLADDAICGILEAGDGQEALGIASRHRPDIIVCDGKMPGLDQDEAGSRLRGLLPTAWIVSYSGVETDKPWADEVITKGTPGDLQRLKLAVLNRAADSDDF